MQTSIAGNAALLLVTTAIIESEVGSTLQDVSVFPVYAYKANTLSVAGFCDDSASPLPNYPIVKRLDLLITDGRPPKEEAIPIGTAPDGRIILSKPAEAHKDAPESSHIVRAQATVKQIESSTEACLDLDRTAVAAHLTETAHVELKKESFSYVDRETETVGTTQTVEIALTIQQLNFEADEWTPINLGSQARLATWQTRLATAEYYITSELKDYWTEQGSIESTVREASNLVRSHISGADQFFSSDKSITGILSTTNEYGQKQASTNATWSSELAAITTTPQMQHLASASESTRVDSELITDSALTACESWTSFEPDPNTTRQQARFKVYFRLSALPKLRRGVLVGLSQWVQPQSPCLRVFEYQAPITDLRLENPGTEQWSGCYAPSVDKHDTFHIQNLQWLITFGEQNIPNLDTNQALMLIRVFDARRM